MTSESRDRGGRKRDRAADYFDGGEEIEEDKDKESERTHRKSRRDRSRSRDKKSRREDSGDEKRSKNKKSKPLDSGDETVKRDRSRSKDKKDSRYKKSRRDRSRDRKSRNDDSEDENSRRDQSRDKKSKKDDDSDNKKSRRDRSRDKKSKRENSRERSKDTKTKNDDYGDERSRRDRSKDEKSKREGPRERSKDKKSINDDSGGERSRRDRSKDKKSKREGSRERSKDKKSKNDDSGDERSRRDRSRDKKSRKEEESVNSQSRSERSKNKMAEDVGDERSRRDASRDRKSSKEADSEVMDSQSRRERSKDKKSEDKDSGDEKLRRNRSRDRRSKRDSRQRSKDRKSKRQDSRERARDKKSKYGSSGNDNSRRERRSRRQSPEGPDSRSNTDVPTPIEVANREDNIQTRTGGAYIPPARLRMMQQSIEDKSSAAYQRLAWEALKKSINGLINKVNTGNIATIVRSLFKENLVRGRGLLCRSILNACIASPTFTNVYAALMSIVNTKFPNIGELMLKRLIIQFRRGYKRNDKLSCVAAAKFIAHLVNQQVAHEVLALEILTLLLESPTEDSVEVAIAFLKEVGARLDEVSPKGAHAIFDRLRVVLHEGGLDKRVQYMIEVMFQVRKDKFRDFVPVPSELDLVEEEDQFTHLVTLDDATDGQDILNVFKHDPDYVANEEKYSALRKEILDESDDDGEGGGSDEEDQDDDEGDEENADEEDPDKIIDKTETNLVALRRTIYLTIQSSLDYEECCHKLLKMNMKEGQEVELCHMILDCCAQQRTYEKFFGLMAGRFCAINRIYVGPFEQIFKDTYDTVHRLDTNKLRNVAKFFAHLLFTDSISWTVLQTIVLTEDTTTSSSRIFVKILCQELCEYMGLQKLNQRLNDPTLVQYFEGIFPRDHPKNTRFSINFFTSIGLGGLTDELREHLKRQPKPTAVVVPQLTAPDAEPEASSSSSSSSSESESSSDDSSSSESSSSSSSSSSSESSSSEEESDASPPPSKKKRSNSSSNKNKSKSKKEDKRSKSPAPKERSPPRTHQDKKRDYQRERRKRSRS